MLVLLYETLIDFIYVLPRTLLWCMISALGVYAILLAYNIISINIKRSMLKVNRSKEIIKREREI